MSVKPDRWINFMARERGMIEPFIDHQVRGEAVSYGLSSFGYDMRVSDEFRILERSADRVMDPKADSSGFFRTLRCDVCEIPPHGLALARSVEYFRIPRNVITIAFGKSTYARCGVVVNVTPFEPEWEGFVTLAISNTGALPARVYANEGIAQVLFMESADTCAVSYADRSGKYQNQTELTHARVDRCSKNYSGKA